MEILDPARPALSSLSWSRVSTPVPARILLFSNMPQSEWIVLAVSALGFAFWVRGCAKRSRGDCSLAMVLALLACGGYFLFFTITRTAYLAAWICAAFVAAQLLIASVRRIQLDRMFAILALSATALAGAAEYRLASAGNALLVIEPYRTAGGWAFDEPRLGIKAEPFVLGIPAMMDKLAAGVPGSEKGIRLIFSKNRFPGSLQLDRRREQDGGNWYHSSDYEMEGWLCPALFKFFPRAPQHLYAKAEPLDNRSERR